MIRNFPKVLLLGLDFNDNTGSGITLKDFLYEWPKDKLAVVTYKNDIDNSCICEKYYYMGKENRKIIFPFGYIKKFPLSKEIIKNNENDNNYNSNQKSIREVTGVDFYKILSYFWLEPVIYKSVPDKKFINWLSSFNPDIIYTQAGSYNI